MAHALAAQLAAHPALIAEALVLALAAALLPHVRRRGPWPAAGFAALLLAATALLAPAAAVLPFVIGAWLTGGRPGRRTEAVDFPAPGDSPDAAMSVLRAIESKLESLFEGVFGRAFRTNVQPVELARKLVKEMDDHRNVSVSRVYVPNEYTVFLSPEDREQFSSYERQLCARALRLPRRACAARELRPADLAAGAARHRRRPRRRRLRDRDPAGADVRRPSRSRARDRPHDDLQAVRSAGAAADRAAAPVVPVVREVAVLAGTASGTRSTRAAVVLGRSKDADLQVVDPNVSRRHAELRQEGRRYWLVDLDSTNGVEVRGKRVKRLKLEDGTRFTLGSTEIAFSRETAMTLASAQVESTLLLLKIAFLVLLYLFIWRIVRSAARDLRLPQESMILGPQQAVAAGLVPQAVVRELGRLVVLASPALREGDVVSLDTHPLTVGRAGNNDVPLPEDEFASGRHARFEPRRDGVYVEDVGSTNGTFVNGIRLTRDRRLDARRRRARRGDGPEVRAVTLQIGQKEVRTDPGRKRHHNEDSYVFQPPLFAIADGMGGARAGEVASALAADALNEAARGRTVASAIVVQLIQEANRRVHERASTDAETSGMGTTITVARVEDDGSVTFGHVGDSRAYLLRHNDLEQLTDDHSLVAELVRRGELSAEAAEVHPQRSVITRALGTDPDVDVDAFSVDGEAGDIYLICSDGLSDMVDGSTIEAILREHRANSTKPPVHSCSPPTAPAVTTTSPQCCSSSSRGPTKAAEPDERLASTTHRPTKKTRSTRRTASHRLPRRRRRPSRPRSRKRRPRRQGSADGSWRSP